MGTVTYPDPEVQAYVEEHFVPVRLDVSAQAVESMNAAWTPTLIVQDSLGREYRRSLGYLDAARFLAEMSLARLLEGLHHRHFSVAHERAADALQRTEGDAAREPEARYFAAIVAARNLDDEEPLIQGWNRLLEDFPESDWAKKAEIIRESR